jgi:hypothetical protein
VDVPAVSERCPICGRVVALFAHPDRGVVFVAHKIIGSKTDPLVPWCAGGGHPPSDSYRNTFGNAAAAFPAQKSRAPN